jgi:hypothetical protein
MIEEQRTPAAPMSSTFDHLPLFLSANTLSKLLSLSIEIGVLQFHHFHPKEVKKRNDNPLKGDSKH